MRDISCVLSCLLQTPQKTYDVRCLKIGMLEACSAAHAQVFCYNARKNILKSFADSEKQESYQAGELELILIKLSVKTHFILVDPHQQPHSLLSLISLPFLVFCVLWGLFGVGMGGYCLFI